MKTIHRTNLQVLNSPFKRTLLIVIAFLACAIGGQAAISVGPSGSGTITFDAFPAPRDWSTITNTGASGDIVDAAGLDLAVQTNAASAITEQLGSSGATAPAIGSAGVARWNSSLLAVQTVPTGVGYVSLMATLQNNTGVNQTALTFSYDLTENHATGGTNANAVVEEVPGHRVYYSASGAPGSWQVIPEISSIGNAGTLIATANVGSWPNGGLLYILWADDNATADRNNTNNEEGGYLIDNVTFKAGVISKAISVGPGGSGTITFDTYPNVLEGWYTMVHTGASADIGDAGTLDSTVQTNVGAAFNRQLGNSATVTPSVTSSGTARWNYTLHAIETVPTGVGYVSLLAAVKNNTGGAQSALTLTYDLGEQNAAGTTVVEEVPGHRVYFSLTGEAGNWTVIPGLSSWDTPGTISATLSLGSWPNGSLLYILWADDNATANRDNANNEEGGYTIDNVSFIPGAINGALITGPTNGQTFRLGVPITINAVASLPGTVTDVAFYHDGVLIGNDATAPYSAIYSNATLGAHSLQAVASDNLGTQILA